MKNIPHGDDSPNKQEKPPMTSREIDQRLFSNPDWQKTFDFLESESIPDTEHYKQFVPKIKAEFKGLFGFEPRVTNRAIQQIDTFLVRHALLVKQNNPEIAGSAETSRDRIRSWVIGEISHNTYKPESTPEYEASVDKQIDAAVAKMEQFYAWLFKNVTIRPETK